MRSKTMLAFGALAIASGGASLLYHSAPVAFARPDGDTILAREHVSQLDRVLGAQGGDEERGCCVTPGAQNKCVYSNAGFCRSQAEKAGLPYEFHPNVSCSSLPQCK